MPEGSPNLVRTSTHWGIYEAEVSAGRLVAMRPYADDPDPAPFGNSMPDAVVHPVRIAEPAVRKSWLEEGPGAHPERRGVEPFVAVSWDKAISLLGQELERVRKAHGNEAIFAGSYGWASAGRFHHAQSQIHRFLNMFGGYTASRDSYSTAAASVVMPHIIGIGFGELLTGKATAWPVIARHTELFVAFGGVPLKNAQVSAGGFGRHTTRHWLEQCKAGGTTFINVGPVRDDLPDFVGAEWLQPRPNTDTALMLGLAHSLVEEGLHDRTFLERCTTGYDRFEDYLLGRSDGQAKDAEWAATVTGIAAADIRTLARRMVAKRTLLTASWSLQRGDHGEQPYWMLITLAAMLGQIGLPGGGFGFGYGAVNSIGNPIRRLNGARFPQGENPVKTFIPVARITDMLTNPGGQVDYNGQRLTYPDIHMVYWAGGNPFHHHQDLNRMLAAWRKPATIVVHDPYWTSMARHSDIVLPVTTTVERNDIGSSPSDDHMVAMHKAIDPVGQARSDFDIFSDLAGHFGFRDRFTEGRGEMDWLRHLYDTFRQGAAQQKVELPGFDQFWEAGHVRYPEDPTAAGLVLMDSFRAAPEANPLPTPSGRIEIFSERVAGFGYDDCPGHPVWLEPIEWLGDAKAAKFPFHMTSNQPRSRLHSQLDHGSHSRSQKVAGREAVLIHPDDAAPRGIQDGDVVRLFNDRGACLAGAVVTDGVQRHVLQLSTGAWYDAAEPGKIGSLEVQGNPNVLTPDKGTSRLAQGPAAHSCLVEVERLAGEAPPVRVMTPPQVVRGGSSGP
ncbi:MAG: molybdopterin guanine dinucleotide-containing S/N-oxide reductase [Alphaproteobacteria bacterium]